MKRAFSCLALLFGVLPALTACGNYDYFERVSEIKSDIFCAETEEFTVSLSCISREYPYVMDGIAGERTQLMEIVLTDDGAEEREYCVYVLGDKTWGGEMSYRSVRGDYFFSQSVETFPSQSVSLRVEWGDEVREISATTVKNDRTLTPEQALNKAVEAEKETVDSLMQDGAFQGEFHVRLLRRNVTYYYVGIVDRAGKTVALLLDAESGEVLARRAQ